LPLKHIRSVAYEGGVEGRVAPSGNSKAEKNRNYSAMKGCICSTNAWRSRIFG